MQVRRSAGLFYRAPWGPVRGPAGDFMGTAWQPAPTLVLAHMRKAYPQSHPRHLWTPGRLSRPCRIASSEPWSICRQPVAGRAGIGFAGFAQALSTGSSTLAVDSALVGCNAGARQFRGDAPGQRRCGADEIAGSVLQAAPVLAPACMSSACPQGHPRRLWTVSAHMGTLPRPLRRALPNWQAARRKPRRHWLCAVCTGLVHRVVHGGCGLWGADARRRPGAVGRQRMRRAGGSSTPIRWRPVIFCRVKGVLPTHLGRHRA